MWDWVKNAGKKALELGGGYLENKAFIESLLSMTPEQRQVELQNKVQASVAVYSGFAITLTTLIEATKHDIRQLKASQATSRYKGNTFEDNFDYFMAEAKSGFYTQKSPALQQAEIRLQMLEAIGEQARQIYERRLLNQAVTAVTSVATQALPKNTSSCDTINLAASNVTEELIISDIPTPDEAIQILRRDDKAVQQRLIDAVMHLFRSEDVAAQQTFVNQCPPSVTKQHALTAISLEGQEAHISALNILATGYSSSPDCELGVVFGKACYQLSREYSNNLEPRFDRGSLFEWAVQGVRACVVSFKSLGKHKELLNFGTEAIAWLEQGTEVLKQGDSKRYRETFKNHMDFLRLCLLEATINLKKYREAKELVDDVQDKLKNEFSPVNKDTFEALDQRLKDEIIDVIVLPIQPEDQHSKPQIFDTVSDQLNKYATKFPNYAERFNQIKSLLEEQKPTEKSWGEQNINQQQLAIAATNVAKKIDEIMAGLGMQSEIQKVRNHIRNASSIFLYPDKEHDPVLIENSLALLKQARDWTKNNHFPEDESDALWGMYLCYNRTKRTSEAVEALQAVRNIIESIREQISEPRKRVYWLTRYPHLFPALCQQLYKLYELHEQNDELKHKYATELLDAIEGAKGRVLADVLTKRENQPVSDQSFSAPVQQLPALMQKVNAHYLTYLMDDEEAYAVLVTKNGLIRAHKILSIGKTKLRELLNYKGKEPNPLNPENRGKKKATVLNAEKVPDVYQQLSGLVIWLEVFVDEGLLQKDDHLCYCPDEFLHLTPLHCLPFGEDRLVHFFSVSRIHSASALIKILKRSKLQPTNFTAVCVSTQDDHKNEKHLANFYRVKQWLLGQVNLSGSVIDENKADLLTVAGMPFEQRLVHFATHGDFPKMDDQTSKNNPYTSSGLLLAKDGKLPADKTGKDGSFLTPEYVFEHKINELEQKINFWGSHVTMQACVSGLAKEGIGGDALGLEWALLLAGASSLLSTHWHVDSQAAADFCLNFYQKWLVEGKSRATAWRTTVLEFMDHPKKTVHHDDWAAFSLSGDWR